MIYYIVIGYLIFSWLALGIMDWQGDEKRGNAILHILNIFARGLLMPIFLAGFLIVQAISWTMAVLENESE